MTHSEKLWRIPIDKYQRYLLLFIVTFGAGITPLWHGILDIYPKDLQDVIPWASLLLSATAVVVRFFSSESEQPAFLQPIVIATFVIVAALIFTSYAAYAKYVIRIEVPATHAKVAYLVGSTPLPSCECAKRGLDIRECIGNAISLNPDDVSACFPRDEMASRRTTLASLYMLVMFALGVLIGLLVVKRKRVAAEELTA
jgi:hypothetical protein